jgi:hypothetical protein
VFTFWGDILVSLSGKDESDELALSDILDLLEDYFRENISPKVQNLVESQFTQVELYEKLCLGVDEMISSVVIYWNSFLLFQ